MASPENTGYKVIIAASASLIISSVAVFLRVICRRLQKVLLLTDDYLIVSALIFVTALGVASLLLLGSGLGAHLDTLNSSKVSTYRQLFYAATFLYAPAVTFAKLSVLFLYRRILPIKQIFLTTSITSSILILWCVAIICLDLVHCLPIAKAWDPSISGRCIDSKSYAYALQIPSIIIDLGIILIPLKVVWDCALELPQKVMASGIFMVGTLTLAGDIIKVVVMLQTSSPADVTYNQVDLVVWMNVEPALAILAACLPVMKPLVHSRQVSSSREERDSDHRRRVDLEGTASPTTRLSHPPQIPVPPAESRASYYFGNMIPLHYKSNSRKHHSRTSSTSGSFMDI